MARKVFIVVNLFFILSSTLAQSYYLPPEWEEHQGVWVSYNNPKSNNTIDQVVKELSSSTSLIIRVKTNEIALGLIDRYGKLGIDLSKISFFIYNANLGTVRDRGPIFILDSARRLNLIEFNFSYDFLYGYDDFLKIKNYSTTLSNVLGVPIVTSGINLEGGAIEKNSTGVTILVKSYIKGKNQNLSTVQIERELISKFGSTKFIWLENGLATDPSRNVILENHVGRGVGGHIDEFCRFVNDSTIFVVLPSKVEALSDPVTRLTYKNMLTNINILKKEIKRQKLGISVIEIPMPIISPKHHMVGDSIFKNPIDVLLLQQNFSIGDSVYIHPVSSYLNFFISNNIVLLPQYSNDPLLHVVDPIKNQSEKIQLALKDEIVYDLFRQYFPNSRIVQINPLDLNWIGGGIHCWTQQMPKGNKISL